jgi:endonuclease/exonuclease/phosphatase family metal-dependent hydrolase
MTVYSWNMLFRNPDLRGALDFIRGAEFDAFCLQEVPERFLPELESLPYHFAKAVDVERLSGGTQLVYLVILSKHPIERSASVPFPDYWERLPLRAKAAVYALRPLHFSRIRNRSGMYADLRTPRGTVRLFNLHLVLAHPSLRAGEFERAMLERDRAIPMIVCGDFNVLEAPHITPLNWILGGKVSDMLLFRRERGDMERRFGMHEVVNALRGAVTHPFSRSQLDHVLCSRHFAVRSAQALADPHGSDHRPVRAELDYI